MSDFYYEIQPVAMKTHRCLWCQKDIGRGEKHIRMKGRYDHSFQDYRMHIECSDAARRECDESDENELCQEVHVFGMTCSEANKEKGVLLIELAKALRDRYESPRPSIPSTPEALWQIVAKEALDFLDDNNYRLKLRFKKARQEACVHKFKPGILADRIYCPMCWLERRVEKAVA